MISKIKRWWYRKKIEMSREWIRVFIVISIRLSGDIDIYDNETEFILRKSVPLKLFCSCDVAALNSISTELVERLRLKCCSRSIIDIYVDFEEDEGEEFVKVTAWTV